jgi:hypothetical protein
VTGRIDAESFGILSGDAQGEPRGSKRGNLPLIGKSPKKPAFALAVLRN